MSRANLEKLWERADHTDKADGMRAYIKYHDLMSAIGNHYGVDVERTTAAYCDKPWTMKEAGPWLTRVRYREVERTIQDMAHDLRMLPHQVQAVLWFTRKRVRGVVYDPQMDMLNVTKEGQRVTFDPRHIPIYKPDLNKGLRIAKSPRDTHTQDANTIAMEF